MRYLRDENYYDELYDRLTIEECRRAKEKTEAPGLTGTVMAIALSFKKGERYAHKSTTIREWMSKDPNKDELLARAVEPSGKRCGLCGSGLVFESKDLMSDDNAREQVLFMLICTSCQKPHAYWEGGEEWKRRPYPCAKCAAGMMSTHRRTGKNIVYRTRKEWHTFRGENISGELLI